MMRSRVSGLTSAYPFKARETVPIETPLTLASWRIVIRSSLISENGFGNRCGSVFTGAAVLSRGAGVGVCHGRANLNCLRGREGGRVGQAPKFKSVASL